MRNFHRNRKAITTAGAAVLMTIILVAAVFGVLMLYGGQIFAPSGGGGTPWAPATPTPPPGQIVTGYSGIVYLEVVNSVTGAGITTATTTVDVVAAQNGKFDFVSGPKDTKTQAANPQGMNTIWPEGTELILMPDCTGNPSNGLAYYSAMYYVKLYQGAPVYELHNINCFKALSTSPYTYQIDLSYATALSQTVQKYESSNIYYWNIGKLMLYPRQAAADFDEYLTYNGATLASVVDASTWVDENTDITANATLASAANEKLTFQMVGGNSNLGWGRHFFVVGSTGKIQEYGGVICFTTAMTGIGNQKMFDEGWSAITASNLYAEKGFYKVLEPAFPAKGAKPGWTVEIPVDASAATASTKYRVTIWLDDCQNLDNIASVGTTTSTPTAYGFVTSYGVAAVVANTALTFSSGAGATMQLMSYITTAA